MSIDRYAKFISEQARIARADLQSSAQKAAEEICNRHDEK
jgi:hypothetical protein